MNKIQSLMPIVNAKIISNGSSFTYEIEVIAPDGHLVDKVKHFSEIVYISRESTLYEIRMFITVLKQELCNRFKVSPKEVYLKGSIYDA